MYWVKLTTDGVNHGFVFAHEVEESSTHITLRGRTIAVPTWFEEGSNGGRMGIKPLTIGDCTFPRDRVHMMAIKRPHRSWYPTPRPAMRSINGIPAAIRAKGIHAMADYAISTTAIGRVLRLEEVRKVLAEEDLLDTDGFYVPNFLENEDLWQAAWQQQRPKAFAAATLLARTEDNCPIHGLDPAVAAYRLMVRMATYRKIDVMLHGQEEPALTPYTGLDAGFRRPLAAGLRLYIGRIRGFQFEQSSSVPDVPAQYQDMAFVESVEQLIHPGIPSAAYSKGYWNAAAIIADIRSDFAKFEEANLLPSIPARNMLIQAGAVPKGYRANFKKEFFVANRLSPTDLARLHIPIYRSKVAQEYLDRVNVPDQELSTIALAEQLLLRILAG